MSIPNKNRDALRNSLQSSLSDVLLDLGMGNRTNGVDVRSFASSLQQLNTGRGTTPPAAFDASFLPSRNNALVAQSLGLSFPSCAPSFVPGTSGLGAEAILMASATAASERSKLLELAKASLLQRKINEESKRLLLQQSYLHMIKEMSSQHTQSLKMPILSTVPSTQVPAPGAPLPVNGEKALEALGTSLRTKTDPYIDVAEMEGPSPDDTALRRTRGGVSEPFPEKLHRMLKEVEEKGLSEIVSFYSHGRAFGVHDMDRFVTEIMPTYFKQSKWNSFARQLNLYGFLRITSGPDAGGYYHELFLKGKPNLALHMRRVGVPQGEDRRKFRPKNVNVEPDFYSMKKVTAEEPGQNL
ncbi:hypothetical protein FisN_4Hh028 [Fistulifera solaris]|uniref:HSF-type DNA-binding domain-containing protein n=1 Tax=Fistulifera solaris TaxID=1519565 RepID=A0A1Z5KQ03_FISSO|nr:hypothetical protein FisN_4Hh028 [Fistulifera solaris]|eukprot:GAX28366.1 hypothetical protein FisN_4Hh028 [Fistulifera solaris]